MRTSSCYSYDSYYIINPWACMQLQNIWQLRNSGQQHSHSSTETSQSLIVDIYIWQLQNSTTCYLAVAKQNCTTFSICKIASRHQLQNSIKASSHCQDDWVMMIEVMMKWFFDDEMEGSSHYSSPPMMKWFFWGGANTLLQTHTINILYLYCLYLLLLLMDDDGWSLADCPFGRLPGLPGLPSTPWFETWVKDFGIFAWTILALTRQTFIICDHHRQAGRHY